MAKKQVTYSVFVRVSAPENIDPNKITQAMHRACSDRGWDFAANIEEELDSEIPSIHELLEEDD